MKPTYSAQFRDKVRIFRSAQNFAVPISENPINCYDSDGGILISISVLGDEKWKLLFFCLHAFSRNPLVVSGRIIYRWKDIFKGNTVQLESWETVQWGRSYSKNKFDEYGPKGGIRSGALNRPSGGPGGDVRVLSTLPGTLEKGGPSFILEFSTGVQSNPGHDKAQSYFVNISPS